MEVKISNYKTFKKIFKGIEELTDSTELKFDCEGMIIRSMDSSHACIVDLYLDNSFFEIYKVYENIKFSIDIKTFLKVIGINDSAITLIYEGGDKLIIILTGTHFKMDLSSNEHEEIEFSVPDYDFIVYANSNDYSSLMKNLKFFGDTCKVCINEDKINFNVNGTYGSGDFTINSKILKNGDEIELKSSYSLIFLSIFSKIGISDDVILKFGKNTPFCCTFNFSENSYISFYLGPIYED